MYILTIVLVVGKLLSSCYGANIVFFEPFGTKSHKNAFMPMALELLRRGHNVSFVSFASDANFVSKGGREVVLKSLDFERMSAEGETKLNFFDQKTKGGPFQKVDQIVRMDKIFNQVAKTVFYDKPLELFIKNEKVDLVMLSLFFGDGYLPLIKQWNCPYVLMSSGGVFPGSVERFGEGDYYASYPVVMSPFDSKMSFFQRVANVIMGEAMKNFLVSKWSDYAIKYGVLSGLPVTTSSLEEMKRNASMMFLNTHSSINFVRSLPPTVVEAGAMHCRPPQPLNEELEDFVAGSGEHGFLVFGLGSAIKVSDMPIEFQKMFLNAFARLKQRVIWKWETTAFDSIPENVKLVKWLPQQDLLGHPKIRAFLSHGGLLSIQEAVYHGVPLIGLPLGSDQDLNVAKTVRDGYARLLDWNDLSEETIYNTIQEIVNNDSYKERAHYYSTLMRDQPETPLERAIFWIEYVIRHRGAAHLQSPAKDLNRLQRNLVDVIAFLIAIALVFLLTSFFITRALFRFLVRKLFAQKSSDVKSVKKARIEKKQK